MTYVFAPRWCSPEDDDRSLGLTLIDRREISDLPVIPSPSAGLVIVLKERLPVSFASSCCRIVAKLDTGLFDFSFSILAFSA
jgi:hypothetical protein